MEVGGRYIARSRCRERWAQSFPTGGSIALVLLSVILAGCGPDSDLFDRTVERLEKSPGPTEFDTQVVQPAAAAQGQSRFDSYIIGQSSEAELEEGLSDELLDIELQFENADIKDVVVTILGDILRKVVSIFSIDHM